MLNADQIDIIKRKIVKIEALEEKKGDGYKVKPEVRAKFMPSLHDLCTNAAARYVSLSNIYNRYVDIEIAAMKRALLILINNDKNVSMKLIAKIINDLQATKDSK